MNPLTFAIICFTSTRFETKVSDLDIFDHHYNLYEMYDYYNQLCFNNQLRPAQLLWSRQMRAAAGICEFVGTRSGRFAKPITIRLSFPLLSFRSEYDITNVLLHEMIHVLQFQQGIFEPWGGHGRVFMMEAMRINSYFGFHITQYHYHIDPEKYKLLDREKQMRLDNTFLGLGKVISTDETPVDVLT